MAEKEHPLLRAAYNGNKEECMRLIGSGVNVNEQGYLVSIMIDTIGALYFTINPFQLHERNSTNEI